MKFYLIVLSSLMKLAASTVDEELQTMFMTMRQQNFIEHFNKQNLSWKIKQYTNLTINLDDDETFPPNHTELRINNYIPFKFHAPSVVGPLPKNFDSRKAWAHCPSIGEIYSQKKCRSCWAHGVANTASDRICIHTGKKVYLSEQDLECSHKNRTICIGGVPANGFQFWMEKGIVTRQCKPYQPQALKRRGCRKTCVNSSQSYKHDKHYAREVYRVPNDDFQIRAEIYLNGPIQASMVIYEDFKNKYRNGYGSGIYVHKYGKRVAGHIVRVVGYGVENGVDFWLVANSWSKAWGENGLFRIKRFQNHIFFENYMFTGIPALHVKR